jgi:hypothetical protein
MKGKKLHGQFPLSLKRKSAVKGKPYTWLKFGDTGGQTDSTIIALMDQTINENYFKRKI